MSAVSTAKIPHMGAAMRRTRFSLPDDTGNVSGREKRKLEWDSSLGSLPSVHYTERSRFSRMAVLGCVNFHGLNGMFCQPSG